MCGIAGIHVKPNARGKINVGHLLDNLLLGIEHRGKDATGFLSMSFDNQIQLCKEAIPAKEFTKKRKSIKGNPQTVIAHTRLATQGTPADAANNHPVQYGTVFVTHNGVIWNDSELFQQNDWERNAAVDTVAIPAILWDMCEGGFDNAGSALEKIDGMMAIAAVDVKQPGKLLLARGYSSPMVMIETKDMIVWASTKEAIKFAWAKVLGTPPSDKKFRTVKEGELFLIDNGVITEHTFDYQVHDYSYGGYTGSVTQGNFGNYSTGSLYHEDSDWTWSKQEKGNKRGYWVTDGDTRRYVEMGTVSKAPSLAVTEKDVQNVEAYTEWAEADVQMQNEAFERVASEWGLSPELVQWVVLYAPQDLLDADVGLTVVHKSLEEAYLTTYDDLCIQYAVPLTPIDRIVYPDKVPAPSHGRVKNEYGTYEWECVDCGEPTPNIYRCNICMVENVNNPVLADYRSAMERDSDYVGMVNVNEPLAIEQSTGGE